ncbi:MAG TPA: hypothetical protein VGJ26_08860 [Pirellulales bacterium]
MFIVMTVLAIWLGWQANAVHERKRLLELIQEQGGSASGLMRGEDAYSYAAFIRLKESRPWLLRRWLGDWDVRTIDLPASMPAEMVDRIARAFPAASIEQAAP